MTAKSPIEQPARQRSVLRPARRQVGGDCQKARVVGAGTTAFSAFLWQHVDVDGVDGVDELEEVDDRRASDRATGRSRVRWTCWRKQGWERAAQGRAREMTRLDIVIESESVR